MATAMSSVGASALAVGTAFVVNVLTSQALGPTGRGEVAYVLQVGYLIAPFLLLGADRSLLRGDVPYHRTLPDLRASTLIAGLTLLVLLGVAALGHQVRLWQAIPVAFMGVVLAAVRAKGIAARRPAQFLRATAGYQTFILIFTVVIFVVASDSITLWIAAYAIPGAVLLVLMAVHALSRGRGEPGQQLFDRQALRLLPGSLATIVVTRGERLALPLIAGTYDLGLYMAVATAAELIAWGGQSAADILVRTARHSETRLRWRLIALCSVGVLALTIALGTALWFAVVPLFGQAFAPARFLVPPLCVAALALCAYRLLIAMLIGSHRPERSSRVEVITAVVAVPVYVAAVYGFGALGAAYGSVVVYLVGCSLATYALAPRKS